MIHFVCGKPGAGKTLYTMRLIVEELRRGKRPIVTNVPIRLGELNEYLQGDPCEVVQRIYQIDETQLRQFWEWRGPRKGKHTVERNHERYEVEPGDIGVLYVLDEVHVAFNARDWATLGKGALFYLSQHRKLGDDVVCTSQAVTLVDKQFRLVAQDFTYISNNAKKKLGLFRLPPVFTRATYLRPPQNNDVPMVKGVFRLDVSGLARCYDTAAGVGVVGRVADIGQRSKGLPWWSALVFLVMLGFGSWGLAVGGVKGIARVMGVRSESKVVGAEVNTVKAVAAQVEPKISIVVKEASADTNRIRLVGLVASGGFLQAALSDGRVLGRGDVLAVGKNYVVDLEGQVYKP